jgi:hypothetical protein
MVEEARLEDVGSGLTPVSPGWFVVNVGEAAWLRHDAFGGRCVFESSGRVLAERPELEPQLFEQLGFTLAVLEPGKPTGMYHAESSQEASSCSRARACCSSRRRSASFGPGTSSTVRPAPCTPSSAPATARA